MSQSNAPGETVVRKKNQVRLIITAEIEFSDNVLNELAPAWDKTALSVMRKLLDDGLRMELISMFINNYHNFVNKELIKVNDISIEAAS